MHLNLEVARSGMRFLANLGRAGMLENSGISHADFERLVDAVPWAASERNRMTQCLQTVIEGSVDALGLERFPLPAEYRAAGIAMFVHPCNVHAACRFMANAPSTDDLARESQISASSPRRGADADQLFALCQMLFSDDVRNSARVLFQKNTGLAIEQMEMKKR